MYLIFDYVSANRRYPGHPLASHLMIHLSEAGTPGGALPAEPGFAGEQHGSFMEFRIHCYKPHSVADRQG